MKHILTALTCLAVTSPASAQTTGVMGSADLATFDYGIICYYNSDAPDTPHAFDEVVAISNDSGYFDEMAVHRTAVIPAIDGIVFGLATALSDDITHDLLAVLIHTAPNGTVTEHEETLSLTDALTTDTWSIAQSTQLTGGTYRFLGLTPYQMFYDVTFTVVPVDAYAGPLPDCVTHT